MEVVGKEKNAQKGLARVTPVELLPEEIVQLWAVLKMIGNVNNSLKGTVMNFLRKNSDILDKAYEKCKLQSNAIEDEYCDFDGKKRMSVWDGKEPGVKGWLEEKDGKITVVDIEEVVLPPNVQMFPYVSNEERRKEYDEKKKLFNQTPFSVNLQKIDASMIERLEIPLKTFNQQPLNIDLFYDKLVNE